jgi:hypothetical protein
MNTERLDKIIMSEEDFNRLFEWRDNHKGFVRNFKPVMDEGLIIVGEGKTKFEQVFKRDGDVYTYTFTQGKAKRVVEFNSIDKTGDILESTIELPTPEAEHEFNSSMISLHASLMAYMEYYSDQKEYVVVESTSIVKKKKKKKGKSSNKRSAIRIGKKIYKVSINNKATQRDTRLYERKTEKWRVRGHYRTLKSGEKIWIEPYIKGEGKEISAKEYRF